MSKKNTYWTEEEIDTLRKTYPDFGMRGALLALPKRSRTAVESKVRDLKLRAKKPRHHYVEGRKDQWTLEEIKILKDNFKNVGPIRMQILLPNRSGAAISRMAYKFKLKVSRVKELRQGEKIKEQDDSFARLSIKRHKSIGQWKADIPAIRSVFDLGMSA